MFLTTLFILLALPCAMAMAAPMGYSVNSDQSPGDTLHQIDLAIGSVVPIGVEVSAGDDARGDIEGLTIAPGISTWGSFGLWAIDEEKFSLFQINKVNGTVVPNTEVQIQGISSPRANDFGMTFTCDDELYASSVTLQTLYRINQAGSATVVGGLGNLGANISALASYGSNPVRIFGLGNGLAGETKPQDNRSLYEIDPDTGIATWLFELGNEVSDYHQAGLSFDDTGRLWAITDRSSPALGKLSSEILLIDIGSGTASVESVTTAIGFESLAVAPPSSCQYHHPVPTLEVYGRVLAILILLITGLAGLRHRVS